MIHEIHLSLLNLYTALDYGINSILFQRGIYPAESFENHQQYGLTILMSTDDKIKDFLKNVLSQTQGKEVQPIFFPFNSHCQKEFV